MINITPVRYTKDKQYCLLKREEGENTEYFIGFPIGEYGFKAVEVAFDKPLMLGEDYKDTIDLVLDDIDEYGFDYSEKRSSLRWLRNYFLKYKNGDLSYLSFETSQKYKDADWAKEVHDTNWIRAVDFLSGKILDVYEWLSKCTGIQLAAIDELACAINSLSAVQLMANLTESEEDVDVLIRSTEKIAKYISQNTDYSEEYAYDLLRTFNYIYGDGTEVHFYSDCDPVRII